MRPDFPFRPASLPFFYGWVIVAAGTVGIVMSVPGQTMGVSLFTDHLLAATGLSRLQLSNAYLAGTLASGLSLPWAGTLVDRLGVRRMVVAACLALAGTLVFLSQSDHVAARLAAALPSLAPTAAAWAVLAAAFFALRFSGQGVLTLVSRTMVGRWFERRRGLVSAISGPFTNVAFSASPLLLSWWIAAAGWRGAWLGMATAVGLGMSVFGWLLYRDNPEECDLHMDGAAAPPAVEAPLQAAVPATPSPTTARDFTRSEALGTPAFWLVTLGVANQSMVGTGIVFHIVSLGAEAGLSEPQAVAIFLPIALISAPVGFAAGAAADRYPVRFLMMGMMLAQLAMFAGAANLASPWLRAMAIGGWGVSAGFFGPLTVAALPGFFGRTHLGAIQGAMMMVLVIGSALGPSLLATFHLLLGSYAPGLYASCLLPGTVLLAAPFVRDPQRLGSA